MIVKRYICSGCGAERVEKLDELNLSSYTEEIIPVICSKCADSPEVKLLEALFGNPSRHDDKL